MAGVERSGFSNAGVDSEEYGRNDDSFAPPPKRQAMASLTCVLLAMFLSSLSQTVVATTMPLIIADLGGFDRYTWAATSYVVAATLAFPIVGSLSDIYGRRLFLLLGLVIFCSGSILLGFSGSMTQVVVFRAVQGIGGGAIMTSCYVSVADLFAPKERGRFHGILTAVYGVSFLIGPVLGGFLADIFSWSWAFSLIGVAGIPVLLITAYVFPKPHDSTVDRDFDIVGMLTLVLAVSSLFVALSSGGVQYEWKSPFILSMLLFSLSMIGIFIVIEARAKSPIMPLSLYADPVVRVSVAIMLSVGFGMYGSVLFLPLYFQVAFDFSATQSGSLLTPMLLGMVAGGTVSGQLLSRPKASYRVNAMIYAGLMTAGLFLFCTMDETTSVLNSGIFTVIAGFGIGGIIALISVGIQNHVPFDVVGTATSTIYFFRSIGGVIGMALLGAVLATGFSSHLEEIVPQAAKTVLADGRFQELQKDPQALVDSAAAEKLKTELAASLDNAAMVQELLANLDISLLKALNNVFVIIFITVTLTVVSAYFYRVLTRSQLSPEDANAMDDKEQR